MLHREYQEITFPLPLYRGQFPVAGILLSALYGCNKLGRGGNGFTLMEDFSRLEYLGSVWKSPWALYPLQNMRLCARIVTWFSIYRVNAFLSVGVRTDATVTFLSVGLCWVRTDASVTFLSVWLFWVRHDAPVTFITVGLCWVRHDATVTFITVGLCLCWVRPDATVTFIAAGLCLCWVRHDATVTFITVWLCWVRHDATVTLITVGLCWVRHDATVTTYVCST